uniref:Uncharacterized protein n=1 Tax=Tanacetum cinerariifolium TaxID=118510 RepID=A0A699I167_TANCI|nr:hypothetical protein [Tanacetum cinerariifolium]
MTKEDQNHHISSRSSTMGEETIKECMDRIHVDTGLGIVRPIFRDVVRFELKGHFIKELRENTFSGTDKHIDKVLEIFELFHEPKVNEGQLMLCVFPTTLTGKANVGGNSEGLDAITAQLSSLGRDMKKLFEHVHFVSVCCELFHGPHLSKDCSNKEQVKEAEKVYYRELYQRPYPRSRYRANETRYYMKLENKMRYQEMRLSLWETLNKFMAESAKWDKENTDLIMEVQASTQTAIGINEASLKMMEI